MAENAQDNNKIEAQKLKDKGDNFFKKEDYQKVSNLRDYLVSYLKDNPELYHLNSFDKDNPYIVNFSTINNTHTRHP